MEGLTSRAQKIFALKEFKSYRRKLAVLRVARTVADTEGEEQVSNQHIIKAEEYCEAPFNEIKNIFN